MADAATKRKILNLILEQAGIVWPLGQVRCLELEQQIDPGPISFLLVPCAFCLREVLVPEPDGAMPSSTAAHKLPLVHMPMRTWSDGQTQPRCWYVWIGQCNDCKTVWWRIRDVT